MNDQRPPLWPRRPLAGRGCRRDLLAAACLILLVVAPGFVATDSAAGGNALACALLSPTQLHSILGLSQSQTVRTYDPTVAISEAVHTECVVGAWSGSMPTSPRAAIELAKSGHGAQIAIQTWEPNDGSPNVKEWIDNDYGQLVGRFDSRSWTFWSQFTQSGWPSKRIEPVEIAGHQTGGFRVAVQGTGKGLVAAVGCWWDNKTHSAICLLDEEAADRPVLKHLNQLAKIAVASFG